MTEPARKPRSETQAERLEQAVFALTHCPTSFSAATMLMEKLQCSRTTANKWLSRARARLAADRSGGLKQLTDEYEVRWRWAYLEAKTSGNLREQVRLLDQLQRILATQPEGEKVVPLESITYYVVDEHGRRRDEDGRLVDIHGSVIPEGPAENGGSAE